MTIKRLLLKVRGSKYIQKTLRFLFYLAGKLPVQKNTIIFESFLGKQYSDNPKAIYKYIRAHYPDYMLYWSVDKKHQDKFQYEEINYLTRFSFRWMYAMATAKYWIVNSRLPLWIPKPKHTIYIQTWHGTPLKKLGVDIDEVHMPGTSTSSYRSNFLMEASKWDYLISPNAYSTAIFKKAFGFNKTIIESGYPRNDILTTGRQKADSIKKELGIAAHKKVILYAPTWRDNEYYGTGTYKFDVKLNLDQMQERFGEEYVIILRMHYLVAENLNIDAYQGFVYDYSTYHDIADLYLISDLLITDYSSVFFDYAILRRPIIFYVYDIDVYRDHLRGFYFDFEKSAPGPLTKTTDEVIDEIEQIEREGFTPSTVYEAFYKRFCYLEDGNASERVVDRIFY